MLMGLSISPQCVRRALTLIIMLMRCIDVDSLNAFNGLCQRETLIIIHHGLTCVLRLQRCVVCLFFFYVLLSRIYLKVN